MAPTIGTGDVIVEERIAPGEARLGDVVTFTDPTVPGRLLTHRVRGMRVDDGTVLFVTRGDANTASERWSAPLDGTIGRVRYRIPLLGYLVHWLGSPFGRVLMLVLPALGLTVLLLRDIWRSPRPARVRS
jgi:signal peptidase